MAFFKKKKSFQFYVIGAFPFNTDRHGKCCQAVLWPAGNREHFNTSTFDVVAVVNAGSSSACSGEYYVGLACILICPKWHRD